MPIREATEDERRSGRDHENVGLFEDPELFELAELLFTSGMSGKKRTKLLKLKRVSNATENRQYYEQHTDLCNATARRCLPLGQQQRDDQGHRQVLTTWPKVAHQDF